MDILTHSLSGAMAATAIAPLCGKPKCRTLWVIGSGGVGAVMPDIDVITRWSGFDATIGRWFDLSRSGRAIYHANLWYSHHNFCHSLVAGVLFTLIMAMAIFLITKGFALRRGAANSLNAWWVYPAAFFLGFCMHLAGDLPTPGSTWHGIKLFWPHAGPVGGFGYIWWWNNYDIFLLLLAGCSVNLMLIFLNNVIKIRSLKVVPLLLCMVVIGAAVFQIAHRPVRFSDSGGGWAEREGQSLIVQRQILGDQLHRIMLEMDRQLPFPF